MHVYCTHAGYVIMYCSCPVHWVSKLQSKIALNTTEAEYIALSMCLHNLLPMRTLLSELSKGFNFSIPDSSAIGTQSHIDTCMHQSTVYEDNTGCIELVNNPNEFHLQTKHIGIK
jgi:hypothetical protein